MGPIGQTYRMRAFAALTGVTVRALRHYDRLGLLTPRRAANRYRVYTDDDRHRLEQIVALKSIGVPLSEIRSWLTAGAIAMADAFARQRRLIEARTRRLRRMAELLQDVESGLRVNGARHIVPWRRLIEVSRMETDEADWREAFAKLQRLAQARRADWTSVQKQQIGAEWGRFVADVQRSLAADPASDHGRRLGGRWASMLRRLYGDDVPLSLFVTAGRHVAEWQADSGTPEFGKWPGFAFLASALAAHAMTQKRASH